MTQTCTWRHGMKIYKDGREIGIKALKSCASNGCDGVFSKYKDQCKTFVPELPAESQTKEKTNILNDFCEIRL